MFNRPVLSLVLVALFISTGCASTWVKRDQPQIPKKEVETLLVSFQVRTEMDDTTNHFVAMYQNQHMDTFGLAAHEKVAQVMKNNGYALQTDKPRVGQLGERAYFKNTNFNKVMGIWIHPQTTSHGFNVPDLIGYNAEQISHKLRDNTKAQHYASITVTIGEGVDAPFAGLIGWSHPQIQVDMKVVNAIGKEIFHARVEGRGENAFGYKSRKLNNLHAALDEALKQMQTLPVTAL